MQVLATEEWRVQLGKWHRPSTEHLGIHLFTESLLVLARKKASRGEMETWK